MKNVRLRDLVAPTTPSKVSIKQPSSLDFLSPTKKISSNNIVVTSELASFRLKREYLPIINKTLLDGLNVKRQIFDDNNGFGVEVSRVSNFIITNDIDLRGSYPQNVVKFPKFTLNTNIKTLPDINFRFILSIKKNKSDSNPQLYTSDKFYNELASSYWENNPYMVGNAIKSEAIVSIVYDDYIKKLNTFKLLELNAGTIGVKVNKNIFVEFNENSDPTINLDDLVRYIDWVVTKPSSNYDERLIDPTYLGVWEVPGSNTTDTNLDIPPAPTSPPITNPPTTPTYPPIGRAGFYPGEIAFTNGTDRYEWITTEGGRWRLTSPPGRDINNSGGLGGGRPGGNRPPQ